MSWGLGDLAFILVFFALFIGLPLLTGSGAVPAALLSAPSGRHEAMSRRVVVAGLFASFAGLWLMGLGAWLAGDDGRRGALEFFGLLLITLLGAGLLLAGLGPVPSWLLEIIAPYAERLPSPFRLAARDLAQRRARAVLAITLAMTATASGIALTIISVGETTQSRAAYGPGARPGGLVVRPGTIGPFSESDVEAVRAAIERELPGVPIVQNERPWRESWHLRASAENVELPDEALYWEQAIGDEKLLRYLTGDQSTPYDEGTAVVITSAEVYVGSVVLSYEINEDDEFSETKTVRATTARTDDPHMETIFVPAKMVLDLGYELVTDELIVDPALHRVTEREQERIDGRLSDAIARVHVERGFEAETGWVPVVAAVLLVALVCALAAGSGKAANDRQARVMRRAGKGAFRWFRASRAGLSALFGTLLGALAGCPAGMLLVWPLTVSTTWDDPPRVPFETPWTAIAAIVVGLPLLAAALAALLTRDRTPVTVRRRTPDRPGR